MPACTAEEINQTYLGASCPMEPSGEKRERRLVLENLAGGIRQCSIPDISAS